MRGVRAERNVHVSALRVRRTVHGEAKMVLDVACSSIRTPQYRAPRSTLRFTVPRIAAYTPVRHSILPVHQT
eukprot:482219-Rhodomonas_salina.1